MPELIWLDEAVEGILDGCKSVLEKEIAEDGDLEDFGIEGVIVGDSARPAPRPPALWVRMLQATCDHSQRSYAEKWVVDVLIIAIIRDNDPATGYRTVNKLASRARSVLLKDRSLGNRKYVQDVRSLRYDPSGPVLPGTNESLHAASATIQVHFVILEQNP